MFRLDWRQQILVLVMLGGAVAIAVSLGIAGYNLAPVPGNAEFGAANQFYRIDNPDPVALAATVSAAHEELGSIDVIAHVGVPVPGRFEPLDHRGQDPSGPFGGPLLALRQGRYPSTPDEAAITDGVADEFELVIGGATSFDGVDRTIVGLVENPSDLMDDFVLLSPSYVTEAESVVILVDAENGDTPFRPVDGGDILISGRGTGEAVTTAIGLLGMAAIGMVLVGLLASAGFVVLGDRRRRQLGMLASIGATNRHLRLSLVANGATVGVVAAFSGAAVGLALWVLARQPLEAAVGYRVDRFNIPIWLVAAIMGLAVATATAAAWWPARVLARASIVSALSGRPDRPRAIHRSAAMAGTIVVAGVAALVLAGPIATPEQVNSVNLALVLGGTVAAVLGALLASPLLVKVGGSVAHRFRLGPRIALRDAARFQSRSSAAVAAIALVLSIPVAIIVSAGAQESSVAMGNMAATQILIRVDGYGDGFVPDTSTVERAVPTVDAIAEGLGEGTVTPIWVAIDPDLDKDPNIDGKETLSLARRVEDGWAQTSPLFVATPEMLALQGIELSTIDPTLDILTNESGDQRILGLAGSPDERDARSNDEYRIERFSRRYSSLPSSFISQDAAQRVGASTTLAGMWLVEGGSALTGDQIDVARNAAAAVGLTIETREDQTGLVRLKWAATIIGMAFALGVLAVTVGMIRSESLSDLRTLTAIGATRRTRRGITASTAAALAAMGVVLGTVTAIVVVLAGYVDVSTISSPPILELIVVMIGTPVVAWLVGWVFGGRSQRSW